MADELPAHLQALLGQVHDGVDFAAARQALGLPARPEAPPSAQAQALPGGGREVVRRHRRPDGTAGEIVDVFRTGAPEAPPPPPPRRKAAGLEPHLKAMLAEAKDELALGLDPVAKAEAAMRRRRLGEGS